MFDLDLRTIVVLLATLSVVQALVLALFSTLVARRFAGIDLWAWASVVQAIGFVLLALRGAVPDLLSIVVANVALVGSLALSLSGYNRFLEHPRPHQERFAVGVVVASAALFLPLTYLHPNFSWRTTLGNGAIGLLVLCCAWSLLRAPTPQLRATRSFNAAVFLGFGAWQIVRVCLSLAGVTGGELFAPSRIQSLSFVLSLAVLLLWSAGIVALILQRLLHDLQDARVAERNALEASARDAERRADESRELLDALTEANRIVREREQLFRLTFDRSPLGAALVALDGRFVRVNDSLVALTGYSEAELLRQHIFVIVAPEDRELAERQGGALVDGIERVSLELRGIRADGVAIWLQATAGLVRGDTGEPIHILALLEDITSRKATEQRLRIIERQQQLVLRTIPEQFWLKDVAGRYLLASDSLASFHGKRPEAFLGRTAEEVFDQTLSSFIRVGDDLVRLHQKYDAEVQLADHNGSPRWLTTTRAPIYDDDGTPLGIVGVSRDITAYKEAEEALRRSNERLELALWGAELGLWDWHVSSGVMETNPQLAQLIGLTPEQLDPVLPVWSAQTHPDDLPCVKQCFERVIAGPEDLIEVEFRIRHTDGSWRWNYARGRAVERDNEGRAVRLIGITRDITARRMAEEQLRAREELLRSVSDNLPDGMIYQLEWLPDGSRRYRYVSAGVVRLWAATPEAIYADPELLWSRIHPDDRGAFLEASRRARNDSGLIEHEMRVCLPDGRVRWSFSRSTPQLLSDGRVLRSGVELDITARKQVEAALQRRVHELTLLYQITNALTSWTNLAEGLVPTAELLREVFGGTATIWAYDAPGRCVRSLLFRGDSSAVALHLSENRVLAEALEAPAASLIELDSATPLLDTARDPSRQAILAPLRARNALVGLLCIAADDPTRQYTPDDLALAQTVAGVLASAIDNANLFAQARSAAAEQERRRLARELHDSVSQALFAASRIAETLPQLWELDPEEGRDALGNLHRFTTGALAEMRALLVELRPPALVEAPLHETLAVLAPTARARGVGEVRALLAEAPLLPPEVQVALYRVAQEALNNVIKHARAQRAVVTLALSPEYRPGEPWEGTASVSVVDDGRGFVPGPRIGEQFGLSTMRERAAEIGAALELDTVPGGGTRVSVSWRGAARQLANQELLVH